MDWISATAQAVIDGALACVARLAAWFGPDYAVEVSALSAAAALATAWVGWVALKRSRPTPVPQLPPVPLVTHLTHADTLPLPADLPDFQNRGTKQRELLTALRDQPFAAIYSLGGMGGIGKTALALHLAHALAADFPGGQRYLDLLGMAEQPLNPLDALYRIARSFEPNLAPPDTLAEACTCYRQALEGRRTLLLLDNAKDGTQIHSLLQHRAPTTSVLITSRRTITADGLTPVTIDEMVLKEALCFARSMLDTSRATDAELSALVGTVGCLPIALRVAGRFLQGHPDWPISAYIDALAKAEIELTLEGDPDKDVKVVLGLSAQQLAKEEASVKGGWPHLPFRSTQASAAPLARRWAWLAVFSNDFDNVATAAVWSTLR